MGCFVCSWALLPTALEVDRSDEDEVFGRWGFFRFAEAILLARWLHDRGLDHLHIHFANSGAHVGYLTAHYLGVDFSLTLHGSSDFDTPAARLLPEKIGVP